MEKYESAKVFEKSRALQEAIEEYKEAISQNDHIQESKIALLRLTQSWQSFDGVDQEKKFLFEMAQTQEEMERLEGWLLR